MTICPRPQNACVCVYMHATGVNRGVNCCSLLTEMAGHACQRATVEFKPLNGLFMFFLPQNRARLSKAVGFRAASPALHPAGRWGEGGRTGGCKKETWGTRGTSQSCMKKSPADAWDAAVCVPR